MSLVQFNLNGQSVEVPTGKTIFSVAKDLGIQIPHLCHKDGLRSDGNCRACVVEVAGERTLSPSCCRFPTDGMKVITNSEKAVKNQNLVIELLLADMPEKGYKWLDDQASSPHGELSQWAKKLDVSVRSALAELKRESVSEDLTHPAIAVNLDACIQCGRCERACREIQVNNVIGLAKRGSHKQVVFDLADSLDDSSCVACGECVQACPTGALMPKSHMGEQSVDRKIDSVCPFCGVGCLVTLNVKDEKIVSVEGRDGPANKGRLCVKGRFGMDYVHSPDRLTKPLIRKEGVAKSVAHIEGNTKWQDVFREATWDEALELAAQSLLDLKTKFGNKALAGFGSAKGSNEEAYLFQKLVRTGFGSNNVDHCTRLCHASSVAALLEGVGSGAVSNPVRDVESSDFIMVIGSNPTANHPVAATWMKNAAQRGTRIVLADPRVTDLGRGFTWRNLQFKPDTDVAMLNAMLHVIVTENLCNENFLNQRAENVSELKEHVKAFSPELMESVCGVPAETIREVARAYATSKASMILWGMGVSQHVHGTDNVRCLIALSTLTGHIGRPGTGLHPLRGQNNVQGASDAGLIPMMFPNYKRVDTKEVHDWYEKFWDTKLDDQPGYTVIEVMNKALVDDQDPHKVHGMYIMGENPAMSDPDLNHARHAIKSLKHLVVQDIFLTETAWLADVVLPASAWPEKTGTVSNTDRLVQMGRSAINPPGSAKPDLWIIQEIATRMGLNWKYQGENHGVEEIYEEMREAMADAIGGISWSRLNAGSVTYPCVNDEDPGQSIVFNDKFPTPTGKASLVPVGLINANERPDEKFPWVLITGRQLEHWHTGSMTRRASVLDAIEPKPTISINNEELSRMGLLAGQRVCLVTRRGRVEAQLRVDDGTPDGTLFMPFAYSEAAANILTNSALDPYGKIPEFKYCAVRLETL